MKFIISIIIILSTVLWCEVGHFVYSYYFNCIYSGNTDVNHDNHTKILVLTDQHIMGPRKSNRFDKMRREWVMSVGFKVVVYLLQPDAIFHLGDSLDEGYISRGEVERKAARDFKNTFPRPKGVKQLILFGNHDIGLHFHAKYDPPVNLISAFKATFTADLETINDNHFVHFNSMAFSNDSCSLCHRSMKDLFNTAQRVDCVDPILLSHYPMFREDDSSCENNIYTNPKSPIVEGKDCLHKETTSRILNIVRPRLIISGHTHKKCLYTHIVDKNPVQEITVSSFNYKNAETNPSFLLLYTNATNYTYRHCSLVNEINTAVAYVIFMIVTLFINFYKLD